MIFKHITVMESLLFVECLIGVKLCQNKNGNMAY